MKFSLFVYDSFIQVLLVIGQNFLHSNFEEQIYIKKNQKVLQIKDKLK